jgi:hypothetical protein
MAGAGYKLFTTGSVLTAAQVNTFLQEQTVMRFANATARTTALSGVLAEGMMSYLDDTNSVEVYNGSAWVSVGSTGDITGVTAGTGISGGGTSGDVTITNSMATAIDAKGDLVVGTGADAFSRLAVGANNTVLTADSSTATGLKWATPSSGGMTLISTTTMSGASVTLSSIPQDYVSLLLVGRFFTNSTADGVLRINPNGDGGIARISGVITSGTFSSTTNILQLPASYDRTNNDNSFQLQIFNYQDTDNYTMPFMWSGNFYAGAVGLMAGGILTANAGPITSLVISNTGGNWAGGTLKFYGVK